MGFGFVGFRTIELAQEAIKTMQCFYIDGHCLEIKFAKQGREHDQEGSSKESKEKSNKLLVKDLPFKIHKKELFELFSTYGKLKFILLPKKRNCQTRGFAFIKFHNKQDTQHALDSLKFSHLLGRHLVIQFTNLSDLHQDPLNLSALRQSQSSLLNLQKNSSFQLKKNCWSQ